MSKILFFLSLFFIPYSFPQTKYLIYFKDKQIESSQRLEKGSEVYSSTLELLSERSIRRRIKNMGEEDFITYEDLPIKTDYISVLESLGIKIENKLRWFNAVSAYLDEDDVINLKQFSFIEEIKLVKVLKFKNPEFQTENLSSKFSPENMPFDYGPSFAQLLLSDVPIVHSRGITGEGILIGVLDTGFDWKNHESLIGANVIAEHDFIFDDNSTADDSADIPGQHGHGTLVFSIIGGFKDSSLLGSAYGSDFILAKTEDTRSETHIEEDNYAAALEWMESYGVDVTSSSLGYNIFDFGESYTYDDMDGETTIVTRAAELAFRRGVVTVTAAGNEGGTSWYYIIAPADGFNTISIGAVDGNNVVAGFSSRGPSSDGRIKPELVARGVSVYGAQAGNFDGYVTASGTSVAAPIASGIVALLLSAHPHLKNTQVRNILFETTDNNSSPDYERGYGLISALKAIEFPNLEETGNAFMLHKIFLEEDDINPQTVFVHYSTDSELYIDAQMIFEGNLTYTFQLPYLFDGDIVDFYFTYEDNHGNSSRNPAVDNYKFFYGQLDVQLNLDLKRVYTDYIVSYPFPNPFNPDLQIFTSLNVRSSGNEKLTIKITDPLGQQIASYNTLTHGGTNKFNWYGIRNDGTPVSSGAYYFLIELGGKQYGRNLILVR